MKSAIEKPIRPRSTFPLGGVEDWFENVRKPFSLLPWPALTPFRFGGAEFGGPSVDMFEHDDAGLIVHAELPGMTRADVEVTIDNDLITISGEKKLETKVDRDDYYRAECEYGTFNRRLVLPEGLNAEKAEAAFKEGVLTIKVPRLEKVEKKGRRIKIH